MLKRERVIILKKFKYSESDLIIHSISSRGEKLHFIAKGALRSRKRFGGGVLEPTHYVDIAYKEKRGHSGLHWLNEAHLLDGFSGIRSDYERLELGFYFLKMTSKVSLEGDLDAPESFILLGQSLRSLESTHELQKLRLIFEAKLLQQQGVLPNEVSLLKIASHSMKEHNNINLGSEEWEEVHSLIQYKIENYIQLGPK